MKRSNSNRSRYWGRSEDFLTWVNELGLEKTWLGRTIAVLESRLRLKRIAAVFLFSLLLTAILLAEFDFSRALKVGDRAGRDIKSPVTFSFTDEVATQKKRLEAERAIQVVLDSNRTGLDETYGRIYSAFRKGRELVRSVQFAKDEAQKFEQMQSLLATKGDVERRLGIELSLPVYEWLLEKRFSVQIETALTALVDHWASLNVLGNKNQILKDATGAILVRDLNWNRSNSSIREFSLSAAQIVDSQDREALQLAKIAGSKGVPQSDMRLFEELGLALVKPTLQLNDSEMLMRRERARAAVEPVQIAVRKGQMLLNEGAVVTPIHSALFSEIEILKGESRRRLTSFFAALLLVVLSLVTLSFFSRCTDSRLSLSTKDGVIMATTTLLVAGFTKFFLFLTNTAFTSYFGSDLPEDLFLYAAPVAIGPMLVALLISRGEVVFIFTLFQSVALSLLVQNPFQFAMVSLVGGLASARGVFHFKKHNDLYWAGLRAGLVNSAMIFLVYGLGQRSGVSTGFFDAALFVPMGLISGLISSVLVIALVPLFESLFNCTTDLKLMELSNLNHPLMKEMIVKAPGTYHHSLVVGSMVEAAAEEIGANPLLAKVMSYYHDIGKTEHAQYFIENQRSGQNPHDHISPNMSKTILIAHVKDGVELGLKHKLGPAIIDGIVQHHGTTLISYFYNRALEQQDDDFDEIHEEDFRYPGPKPQFRESALIMLADSIEAAARSLDEPTPARLQNIVKNIISRKFTDGQLEECDLTLRDLGLIEAAFNRVLLGIYHQRIDYPKHMGGGAADAPTSSLSTRLTASARGNA